MAASHAVSAGVVAVLLTLLCGSAHAADCATALIASRKAEAQTACDVTDLALLRPGDGFTSASELFCEPACKQSITRLVLAYGRACAATDERRLHEEIQQRQHECSPPETKCTALLLDYLFWSQSTEGDACAKLIKTAATKSGTEAQTAYAEICDGACGTKTSELLAAMAEGGCRRWPAYLSRQLQHSQMCLKVDSEFCWPKYVADFDSIASASDATLTATVRSGHLDGVCTNCFYEMQRTRLAYGFHLGIDNTEAELCVKDNGRFCLPAYDAAVAQAAASPQGNRINTEAQLLCSASMNRCAAKIWAHRMANQYTTEAEAEILRKRLLTTCMVRDTGDEKCAGLLQEVAGGKYQEKDDSFASCSPENVKGQCVQPPTCTSWPRAEECPHGCSNEIKSLVAKFGCCFKSMKELHLLLTSDAAATNALFARMEFLSSECCAYQGAPCFRTLHDVCDPFPQTTTFSVEVSVPYSWISHRVEDFKLNLAKDISANLGVDAEGLTLGDFVEKDASTTSIDFTVRAQTEAAANLIKDGYVAQLADNTLVLQNVEVFYATRCMPGVTADCNGAGLLAPSGLLLLLALVLVW